jgi:hypothetical protein
LLTLLSSLVFTPGVAVAWRLSTALAILVLAIRPLRGILWCRGARAVTRAEWDRQGQWRIGFKDQQPTDAVLLNESAILGPCLFLIWSQRGRRRYALIDRPTADPLLFARLRGRLSLEGRRHERRLEPRT